MATGATTSGINFALADGGRLSGVVTDAATAAPLNVVTVEVYDEGGALVAKWPTDSTGVYQASSGLQPQLPRQDEQRVGLR